MQMYMPVSQCHCATLSHCLSAIVPHCPFVTVPLRNKLGGGGKILNVYDDTGHLVLHSTTLPPAFRGLQLYVKCHIQRSEERQWFEVTDVQVFEPLERFVRCSPCSCVQGCTNPSIVVA
jgi:hypothetical protein